MTRHSLVNREFLYFLHSHHEAFETSLRADQECHCVWIWIDGSFKRYREIFYFYFFFFFLFVLISRLSCRVLVLFKWLLLLGTMLSYGIKRTICSPRPRPTLASLWPVLVPKSSKRTLPQGKSFRTRRLLASL